MKKYRVIGKFHKPVGDTVELREEEGGAWVKLGRLEPLETAVSKTKRQPRKRTAKKDN